MSGAAESALQGNPEEKAFADWLGQIVGEKAPEGLSPLQKKLRELNEKQKEIFARGKQVEDELNNLRSQAIKHSGAGEALISLLREEFAQSGRAAKEELKKGD